MTTISAHQQAVVMSWKCVLLMTYSMLIACVNATSSKMDFLPLGHVRTDPVTDRSQCGGKPGVSPHVHTFYGAAASLRPTTSYEEMRAACGNSGNVDDNKSLYWHPTIYRFDRFDNQDYWICSLTSFCRTSMNCRSTGQYHIEEISFASAYYIWRTPEPNEPRTFAFPPGFQMIARQSSGAKARVVFDCRFVLVVGLCRFDHWLDVPNQEPWL